MIVQTLSEACGVVVVDGESNIYGIVTEDGTVIDSRGRQEPLLQTTRRWGGWTPRGLATSDNLAKVKDLNFITAEWFERPDPDLDKVEETEETDWLLEPDLGIPEEAFGPVDRHTLTEAYRRVLDEQDQRPSYDQQYGHADPVEFEPPNHADPVKSMFAFGSKKALQTWFYKNDSPRRTKWRQRLTILPPVFKLGAGRSRRDHEPLFGPSEPNVLRDRLVHGATISEPLSRWTSSVEVVDDASPDPGET